MNILIEKSIFSWLLAIFKITLARQIFRIFKQVQLQGIQILFRSRVAFANQFFVSCNKNFIFVQYRQTQAGDGFTPLLTWNCWTLFFRAAMNCFFFSEEPKLRYKQLFVWQQLVNADRLQVGIISSSHFFYKRKCASLNRPKKLGLSRSLPKMLISDR